MQGKAKYALKLQRYAKLKTVLNAFFIENPDINTIENANKFGSERKKCQIFSKKCQIFGFSEKSAKPEKKCQIFKKGLNPKKDARRQKKVPDFWNLALIAPNWQHFVKKPV